MIITKRLATSILLATAVLATAVYLVNKVVTPLVVGSTTSGRVQADESQIAMMDSDSAEALAGPKDSESPGPTETMEISGSPTPDPAPAQAPLSAFEQRQSDETREYLDTDNFEQLAGAVEKETNWTPAKHETMVQADLACKISFSNLQKLDNQNARIDPPMEKHVANVQAMRVFVKEFCKNHAQKSDKRFTMSMTTNHGVKIIEDMKPGQFTPAALENLIAFVQWEYQPHFAYQIALMGVYHASADAAIAELMRGDLIPSSLNRDELATTYGLAAESVACRKSSACAAGRPYTMIRCMERSACEVTQSLSAYRQRWVSPVVWETAQRLAASWTPHSG